MWFGDFGRYFIGDKNVVCFDVNFVDCVDLVVVFFYFIYSLNSIYSEIKFYSLGIEILLDLGMYWLIYCYFICVFIYNMKLVMMYCVKLGIFVIFIIIFFLEEEIDVVIVEKK